MIYQICHCVYLTQCTRVGFLFTGKLYTAFLYYRLFLPMCNVYGTISNTYVKPCFELNEKGLVTNGLSPKKLKTPKIKHNGTIIT